MRHTIHLHSSLAVMFTATGAYRGRIPDTESIRLNSPSDIRSSSRQIATFQRDTLVFPKSMYTVAYVYVTTSQLVKKVGKYYWKVAKSKNTYQISKDLSVVLDPPDRPSLRTLVGG